MQYQQIPGGMNRTPWVNSGQSILDYAKQLRELGNRQASDPTFRPGAVSAPGYLDARQLQQLAMFQPGNMAFRPSAANGQNNSGRTIPGVPPGRPAQQNPVDLMALLGALFGSRGATQPPAAVGAQNMTAGFMSGAPAIMPWSRFSGLHLAPTRENMYARPGQLPPAVWAR